jgi:hypothetical protein
MSETKTKLSLGPSKGQGYITKLGHQLKLSAPYVTQSKELKAATLMVSDLKLKLENTYVNYYELNKVHLNAASGNRHLQAKVKVLQGQIRQLKAKVQNLKHKLNPISSLSLIPSSSYGQSSLTSPEVTSTNSRVKKKRTLKSIQNQLYFDLFSNDEEKDMLDSEGPTG